MGPELEDRSPLGHDSADSPDGGDWWERLRYTAADILTAGALSNRLVEASAAADAPITTGRRIVVVGVADGAWASTLAALLAGLFGRLRREPVLAVDLSYSGGLLRYAGAVHAPPLPTPEALRSAVPERTLAELLAPAAACGHHVFALGQPSAHACDVTADPEWSALSSRFSRLAAVTIVDAGPSPQSPQTAALLGTAHAAVVVAPDDASGDEREAAVRLAFSRTFPELPLLTVWTGSDQLGEAGGELSLPQDRHLSRGGTIRFDRVGARTRLAATEIAGAVLRTANQG